MRNRFLLVATLAVLAFTACKTEGDAVIALRLDVSEMELVKGTEKQLVATTVPLVDDVVLEWRSSMPEYVSVSETGVVKAEKIYYKNETDTEATPVSIYCVCEGGAAECKVTVLPLDVERMEIVVPDGASSVMLPGEQQKVGLAFYPEDADVDADQIVWSTTAFEYAVVEEDKADNTQAYIKAIWPGSVSIKAVYGKKSATLNLVVKPIYVESVSVEGPEVIEMKVGDAKGLSASLIPENATVELVWSSTDTRIATVDADTGIVTAVSEGEVKINAVAGIVQDDVTIKVVAQ